MLTCIWIKTSVPTTVPRGRSAWFQVPGRAPAQAALLPAHRCLRRDQAGSARCPRESPALNRPRATLVSGDPRCAHAWACVCLSSNGCILSCTLETHYYPALDKIITVISPPHMQIYKRELNLKKTAQKVKKHSTSIQIQFSAAKGDSAITPSYGHAYLLGWYWTGVESSF